MFLVKIYTAEKIFTRPPVATVATNFKSGWGHSALAQSQVAGTLYVLKLFFGRFLLRLSLIKPNQVIFMIKFSPTALNFGYDLVLLEHFLGHAVYCQGTSKDASQCLT